MKSVLILIFALFLSSCCGTKKAIEAQPEPTKEVAVVTEAVEAPEPISNNGEINEMVEVVDNNGKTIAEVSSHEEAKEIVEKHKDSTNKDLSSHQNTSKRFYENHQLWDELLSKHVSETGEVNYDGFNKDSKDLSIYINMLKMGYSNIDKYSKNQKLAYWINAYNALTIDLILRNYPTKSIKDIKDPWDQRLWKFGDKWQNLNDIEHKILRKMNEPRIHFAIVCASVSCPKLYNEAFTASNLEEQLTKATKEFLSDTSKNELSKDKIKLSKIFKWFKKDFEEDGSLIDFLNLYSEVLISDKAKKSFKDYDWNLND